MTNSDTHSHDCTVCGEPIGEHETVVITCEHTKQTTTTRELSPESDTDTSEDNDLTKRQRELINELYRVADVVGHSPSIGDMRFYGDIHESQYEKQFGGWNAAKDVAGLETYAVGGGPNVPLSDRNPEEYTESGNVQVDLSHIQAD